VQGVKSAQARGRRVASEASRAAVRRVVERRLVWERAAFFGLFAGFLVVLTTAQAPTDAQVAGLLVWVVVIAVVGAGYDGAREAVEDTAMLAGLLERAGPGATVEPLRFMMHGHYEVWVRSEAPGGTNRFGVSFANALVGGPKRSVYLVQVPVPPGPSSRAGWQEPARPLREVMAVPGGGKRRVEIVLRRARGGPWHVRLFLRPGRPADDELIWRARGRAEQVAAAVADGGPSAVPWGQEERFRPPDPVAPGGPGAVTLGKR
jgi:hypothetical protein